MFFALEKASIEVATQAMADLFSAPWPLCADQWVDTAIATGSIHLLASFVCCFKHSDIA